MIGTINIVVVIIIIIIIILSPPAKSRQPGKLGQTYKIMVATAIYSVTMVLWKETAFPLCRAMERRWKRNVVSRVSSMRVVIRLILLLLLLSRYDNKEQGQTTVKLNGVPSPTSTL